MQVRWRKGLVVCDRVISWSNVECRPPWPVTATIPATLTMTMPVTMTSPVTLIMLITLGVNCMLQDYYGPKCATGGEYE